MAKTARSGAPSAAPRVEYANIEELNAAIRACTRCPLRQTATGPVCGVGELNAKFLLIGEAPGREEDASGVPFVGLSGKRLNKLLEHGHIDVNYCYFTNTVRCRPPANRTPRKKEIMSCLPWLLEEIRLVNPEMLITLGSIPLSLFCDYGIRTVHGTMLEVEI